MGRSFPPKITHAPLWQVTGVLAVRISPESEDQQEIAKPRPFFRFPLAVTCLWDVGVKYL